MFLQLIYDCTKYVRIRAARSHRKTVERPNSEIIVRVLQVHDLENRSSILLASKLSSGKLYNNTHIKDICEIIECPDNTTKGACKSCKHGIKCALI